MEQIVNRDKLVESYINILTEGENITAGLTNDYVISKFQNMEDKRPVIEEIRNANIPILFSRVVGFERNGLAVSEVDEIDIDKVEELFSYREDYFVYMQDDKIIIKRYDRI